MFNDFNFDNIEKWFNPIYYPYLTDKKRINVIFGGAGSGKSVFAAQREVLKNVTRRGANLITTRKVHNTIRDSAFGEIKKVIYQWGLQDQFKINESDYTIRNVQNENMMIARGLDDPEKIKSVTAINGPITRIWGEEASEFTPDDVDTLNERLRGIAVVPFQFTLTFNPIVVTHFLKAKFIDRVNPDTTVLKTTYLDNKFIDKNYKEQLEAYKETNPIRYQVYCLGDWGQAGDAAFYQVDYAPCRYKFEDFDQVRAGMDFGYEHYHAIELIGLKDGELYSFAELYVKKMVNSDIIAVNDRRNVLPRTLRVYADSAEPKSIEDWRRAGYLTEAVKKGPDSVYAGFQYLRSHKWHIDETACPGLATEVRGAAVKKDRQGQPTEEIFSFHDDALAAARYAIEGLIVVKDFTLY